MAVSLRGYTQGAFSATGVHTVAWPSGTAVNDLAIILCATGSDKKPKTVLPIGWVQEDVKSDGTSIWSKILTATDIASPLTVTARIQALQVFTGAAGVGKDGSGESLTITKDGGLHLLAGWKATTATLTASAKVHATDISNGSYIDKHGNPRVYNTWTRAMPTHGTSYIDTNASAFFSLEILPRTAPYAPTILAPVSGEFVDAGVDYVAKWIHNGPSGNPAAQIGVSINLFYDATDHFVTTGTSFTIGAVPYIMQMQTEGFLTIPGASIPAGKTIQIKIATGEATGGAGPYASTTFYSRTKPTVSVAVTGTGLTRTVTATPTITNGTQTWWRLRVCPAAATSPDAPLFDTGVQSGTDVSYAIPPDIGYINGASYKAWWEFGQTGGQQTVPTASSSFTVSWTPPAGPSSVTVQADSPMKVVVAGLTVGRRVRLVGTVDGVVRCTYIQTAAATTVTFTVPLAPYGEIISFAVDQAQVVSGVELWSTPVTELGIGYDPSCYLVAPDGTSWLQAHLDKVSEPEDTEGVLVSYGLGASVPTVTRTPSQGWKGAESLIVTSQAEKDALFGWLTANPTFILRYPPERDRAAYADVPPRTMARTTALAEGRVVQKDTQIRTVAFSWVQQ